MFNRQIFTPHPGPIPSEGRGRSDLNPRRIQVRFVVIDAKERFIERERHGLRRFEADEQSDAQPRPLRGGDRIELQRGDARFTQRRLRDRQEILQMLARGEFRHHPAIFSMQFDLRGNDVGQDFTIAHDRSAGFIAGSFDGEEGHIVNNRNANCKMPPLQ